MQADRRLHPQAPSSHHRQEAVRGRLVQHRGPRPGVPGRRNWKAEAFRDVRPGPGPTSISWPTRAASTSARGRDKATSARSARYRSWASGYGGGVGAFITFAAAVYNMDLDAMARSRVGSRQPRSADRGERHAGVGKEEKAQHVRPERPDVHRVPTAQCCPSGARLHPATAAPLEQRRRGRALSDPRARHHVHGARLLKIRRDGAWLRIRLPSGRLRDPATPSPRSTRRARSATSQGWQYAHLPVDRACIRLH